MPRELIQFGYNASFEGHAPVAAYAFYYRNQPDFLHNTNLTLRLAIAPTYLDSELGIIGALSPHTDVGIGVAGGGFSDTYDEIEQGTFIPKQSFDGHGAETSLSIYHLFNPGGKIPLNGVLRGTAHYSFFERDNTVPAFRLPNDQEIFDVRAGLRWGGKEPTLFPSLGMELSVWYEGEFRTEPGAYGYAGAPYHLNPHSHLFWGQALLAYTLPNSRQNFYVNLTAGTSVDADRFSAYRLGALLPMVSEFPLSLPGYYYQEISAQKFVLLGGNYIVPLDPKKRWNVNLTAATAGVDYLHGLQQPGDWLSGVGVGILYRTPSLKIMVGYAYGVDAIRDHHRGAHSVGVLMQFDLGHVRREGLFNPGEPGRWRGLQRIFGGFGE